MNSSNFGVSDPIRQKHYSVLCLIVSRFVFLVIFFFPYLFAGKTFLPSDMLDTMTAPFNAEYGPPQAQNQFPFDGLAQTFPYKLETKEALKNGKLAYWNPHILAGYPQYAETMANNFDPFNILLLWFGPADVILLETFLEMLIAGIGMILLLRFFGVTAMINLLFALAYMLNSLFITSAMHRWIVASFCWMPLITLMILNYYSKNDKQYLLFASLFLAISFLGGNFQTAFFIVFVCSFIILFYPVENLHSKIRNRLGILVILGLAGFALSAIMWLPSLELLIQTLFQGGSLNSSNVYYPYGLFQRLLSLPLLTDLFIPGIFGGPQIYSIKKLAQLDPIDFNGGIGFVTALFAFWGCLFLFKNIRIRPFIIVAVLGLLLPIVTPLYHILYHRFFIVSTFSLCVVGAFAFQSFVENESVRGAFTKIFKWTGIIFATAIALFVSLIIYISLNYDIVFSKLVNYISPKIAGSTFGVGNESWMLGRIEKTLHYYSFSSTEFWYPITFVVIGFGCLYLYQKNKLQLNVFLSAILFVTGMQLFIFGRIWLPSIDTKQFPIYPTNPIVTYLQHDSSEGRFIVWRDVTKDRFILLRNGSTVYKTNDIHGYESLTNRCMIEFYLKHVGYDTLDLRLLGLANVKYVIGGKKDLASPSLRLLYTADSINIYENELCKPRAYFAYKSKVVESDSAAAVELLRQDFDGSKALFIKDQRPEYYDVNSVNNSIHFNKSGNEEVDISVETGSKGVFILTDTYYPGWKCYVDGKRTPIYRVNYCMRGVVLEAGKSRVIFRFEPDIFTAGAGISGVTAMIWCTSLLLLRRKKIKSKA